MEELRNPYAAPVAPALPERLPPDMPPLPGSIERPNLAGRGERLLAKIIDRVLFLACWLPFVIALFVERGSSFGPALGLTMFLGVAAALGLFIYNLILLNERGQTLGKRWLGIRIVRADGQPADLGTLFGLRIAVPWLIAVFVGPLFTLPDALCILGGEKRCLHDLMAGTIVIVA